MVLVEVRSPIFNEEKGKYEWSTLALVRADGDVLQVSGNETGIVDPEMPVLDIAGGSGKKIAAQDAPELWVRNLPFAFRAGDVVAEVMVDDDPTAVDDEVVADDDLPTIPAPSCRTRGGTAAIA